jgi:hypothetical protein
MSVTSAFMRRQAVRGFFALGRSARWRQCRAGGNRSGGSSTRDKAGALMQPVAAPGCNACAGRPNVRLPYPKAAFRAPGGLG